MTDADDPRLAPYRDVADPPALRRAGLFAAEGRLVVPRLLASDFRVHSILLSDSALPSMDAALEARPDVDVFVAPVEIISGVAGFDFHRGCVALGWRKAAVDVALESFDNTRPVSVLFGVSNPDNIGGIFRSAHALGASGVLLAPGCGDPLYRKAIRTSMGTTLQLPWAELSDWPRDLAILKSRGYLLVALTPDRRAATLREIASRATKPLAFLLGSEGYGLSKEVLDAADAIARIPMAEGDADSLNVAAAAAIALYECAARAGAAGPHL